MPRNFRGAYRANGTELLEVKVCKVAVLFLHRPVFILFFTYKIYLVGKYKDSPLASYRYCPVDHHIQPAKQTNN